VVKQRPTQAYRQAPWRIQLQWIGIVLLGLVVVVLIAGFYLYVSAQATAAGTAIKELEYQREDLQISIADLHTQLANLNSAVVMMDRALEVGYHPATQADLVYVKVEGYPGRQIAFIAPPPSGGTFDEGIVLPTYQQSLWDLFFQGSSGMLKIKFWGEK
jgi:cell division protein FtsL